MLFLNKHDMNFIDSMKARLEEVEQVMTDKAIESGLMVDAETSGKRLTICQACPRLFQPTGTCLECGCFVKAKTKLGSARCPLGKW
jgi:hypothetical protein